MITGIKIERQGDGSYEVIFENGNRVSGYSLSEAVALAENQLYPAAEEQESMQKDNSR